MEIKYLGHSSFLIKNKQAKLVTDPYDSSIGLKFPKVEAEVVTVSHQHFDHNQSQLVNGTSLIIDLPGEYEKSGFRIFGFRTYHDKEKGAKRGENVIYKIETEGVSILHCGDLCEVLTDEFVDQLGSIDALLVPVGGFYTIGPEEAKELVKKIEPSIVIPMHYNHPKLNQKNFGMLATVDDFFKKMGVSPGQALPKLVVKKEEMEEEMKVIRLEISS
ncbi:MAG: MBL fold metallo-hydrolase [Patescibacteria group bacterium]|nr:MBL fold metallo-hydrolase [Patescibacteria group bacterium]